MKDISKRDKKRCWSCKETKPIEMFHRDSYQKDGHNGMCKECRRIIVRTQPHRKIWKKNHPEKAREINAKYRLNNKEKLKAWLILRKAVKEGAISKEACRICGKSAHAHHPDYSKPLEVIWLCQQHHKDIHYGRIVL